MRRARVLTGAGLALALAFCGTGAWTYAQARGDDSLAYGRERDEALADGRERLAVLNTLDASSRERARDGIQDWHAASTGPLRDELGSTVPRKGASARGTVTEAALTALDTRAGTAKLIATVRVEVTPTGSKTPTTDRKRLEAVLARTGEGEWKVKALSAVPLARTAEEDESR
jgi:Mce-associated membrane protein